MNSVSFKSVKLCTKLFLFIIFSFSTIKVKAWEVDFSRRQVDFKSISDESRLPASSESSEKLSLVEQIIDPQELPQDIVVLSTDKGFVPDQIRLKKHGVYKIHVVNVNATQKNTSFVLDAFSEFHATSYGVQKTFQIRPKKEGIFSFNCPETAIAGKLVIYDSSPRKLSSAAKD